MSSTEHAAPPTPAERLAEIHAFREQVLSTAVSGDVLEIAMATAISQRVTPRETPPVWLLLVGPPSLGKTAGADFLRDTEAAGLTRFVNSMSPKALDSGLVDSKTGKRAPWLLDELDGRCWVNTELNALLNEDDRTVQKITGTLTAAFDGHYTKSTGSAVGASSSARSSNSRFSFIGCVTPETLAKHSHHLRNLGPRFLTYRVLSLTDDEEARGFELLLDAERPVLLTRLRGLIREHLEGALAGPEVTIPPEQERLLQRLARIVANGRTSVWRERETNELMVGEPEGPFRVYQQLRSLLIALGRIHGTPTPLPRALRLVRDVALSSILPGRADALRAQRQNPCPALVAESEEGFTILFGLTVPHLADVTGWSQDRAGRVLDELVRVGLYEERPDAQVESTPGPGRRPISYAPVEDLRELLVNPFVPAPGKANRSEMSPVDRPTMKALEEALLRLLASEGNLPPQHTTPTPTP